MSAIIQAGLDRFKVFRSLTEEQKVDLSNRLKVTEVDKYEYVYRQGDASDALYILAKGTVKLGQYASDGREAIKEVLHSPGLFGASILHGEEVRGDFAQALSLPVTVYSLSTSDFKYFMRINHRFCLEVVSMLSRKLNTLENRMSSLMVHDARGRIIEFIKKSAKDHGRLVGMETLIKHSLTQQEIANMTGTSRQTVTHVLNDLKKLNLIYFNRKSILVRDIAKLA